MMGVASTPPPAFSPDYPQKWAWLHVGRGGAHNWVAHLATSSWKEAEPSHYGVGTEVWWPHPHPYNSAYKMAVFYVIEMTGVCCVLRHGRLCSVVFFVILKHRKR